MQDGFIRIAAATPAIEVANCPYNAMQIIEIAKQAADKQVHAIVFPELCLTGCTCGDLYTQRTLRNAALEALSTVLTQLEQEDIVCIVGLPLAVDNTLYNCAAVCYHGKLLGIIPKSNNVHAQEITVLEQIVPFGTQLVFSCQEIPAFQFGVVLFERPHTGNHQLQTLSTQGATVIFHPSSMPETADRDTPLKARITGKSSEQICAYVYAEAGQGESSANHVYAGHNLIAENGALLAQNKPFSTGFIDADIDLELLQQERLHAKFENVNCKKISFSMPPVPLQLQRTIPANPFLPTQKIELPAHCERILNIQAHALKTRLTHIGCKQAVLGVSGGLDSTLALLATVCAFDLMKTDPSGITAVSMPCFGTTSRTRQNAQALATALGCNFREIDISGAVTQHFSDIGQEPTTHDAAYENAQARERTQVLMDIANQLGGIVIGTGDLSESALGWTTYNGDHMSMYSINCGIPKTVIQHIVSHCMQKSAEPLREILTDILQTPVSPELLPSENDAILQKTEDLVGPYALHDFFLYYTLRYGFTPHKIFRLASLAHGHTYDSSALKHWLTVFYERFFAQQFKRSCMPEGPAIYSISLSPRSGFYMPGDISKAQWQQQIEAISLF